MQRMLHLQIQAFDLSISRDAWGLLLAVICGALGIVIKRSRKP
jgi:hypothetical protein